MTLEELKQVIICLDILIEVGQKLDKELGHVKRVRKNVERDIKIKQFANDWPKSNKEAG